MNIWCLFYSSFFHWKTLQQMRPVSSLQECTVYPRSPVCFYIVSILRKSDTWSWTLRNKEERLPLNVPTSMVACMKREHLNFNYILGSSCSVHKERFFIPEKIGFEYRRWRYGERSTFAGKFIFINGYWVAIVLFLVFIMRSVQKQYDGHRVELMLSSVIYYLCSG